MLRALFVELWPDGETRAMRWSWELAHHRRGVARRRRVTIIGGERVASDHGRLSPFERRVLDAAIAGGVPVAAPPAGDGSEDF